MGGRKSKTRMQKTGSFFLPPSIKSILFLHQLFKLAVTKKRTGKNQIFKIHLGMIGIARQNFLIGYSRIRLLVEILLKALKLQITIPVFVGHFGEPEAINYQ